MSASKPRIIFAGTPDFAVPALERLISMGLPPVAVFTQPDRPAGRGRKLQASPVKKVSVSHQIPVFQPESFKQPDIISTFQEFSPDIFIVAAYGLILPQQVLDIPAMGCWNIHASLLPRWRGAAPIQRAIEAGDKQTGVCIMRMEAGLDTGPIWHSASTLISASDTGGSLHDRLADMGADALQSCLERAATGELGEPEPQDNGQAVYAPKIGKAEAELDWARAALALERKVRAFNPWPVAWFNHEGTRLRVWRAEALGTLAGQDAGRILATGPEGIDVATGDGVLRLLEVQGAGGRRMSAAEYLNARSLA